MRASPFVNYLTKPLALPEACIQRKYVPLYFIVPYWSGSSFVYPAANLVRETCWCVSAQHLPWIHNFFAILSEPDGVQRIGSKIRKIKKDLLGRRIMIKPSKMVFASWETAWRDRFTPFSFRDAHQHEGYAYVGIFDSLIHVYNFTFDLIRDTEMGISSNFPSTDLLITIGNHLTVTAPLHQTCVPPLSLDRFTNFRTFYFTSPPTVDRTQLPSLKAPISDSAAAVILLILSIFMAITLLLLRGKAWNVTEALLFTFSGFIGKDSAVSGNSKFWLLYTTWLFLVGFLSMAYTNILQSILVVPGTLRSGLTFEQMVRVNFTFETPHLRRIQSSVAPALPAGGQNQMNRKILSALEKERILAGLATNDSEFKMMELKGTMTHTWFVQTYSDATKRSLVVLGDHERYYKDVGRTLGWDVVAGQEEFFKLPTWWNFELVERGTLLANSIEMLKQSGFLNFFVQLADSKTNALRAAALQEDFHKSKMTWKKPKHESSAPLGDDAFIIESFLLFFYGACAAVLLRSELSFVSWLPSGSVE